MPVPRLLPALLLVAPGPVAAQDAPRENRPPLVELQQPSCVRPGARPRACARVTDDHGVAQVRALFRAVGAESFHSTVMLFDGTRYCAWLPAPLPGTGAVEVYVEGLDDEYELSRGPAAQLEVDADCAVEADPAPAPPTSVRPTTPGQPSLPDGFDPESMRADAG